MAMPEAPPEEIAEENASPELAIPELHSVVEGSVTWPCWAGAGGNTPAEESKRCGHVKSVLHSELAKMDMS